MARRRTYRVKCGHPDCNEYAFFEPYNLRECADLDKRYGGGKWRCVRHTRPDENLSAEQPIQITEIVSREEGGHKYFGNSGFAYGPGFKAWADDFPVGTILRVTAEVILPDTSPR